MNHTSSRRSFLVGGGAGALWLLGGRASVGTDPAGASVVAPSAVDIGFCRDMSAHHGQALVMCQRVLGRPTGDPVQAAAAEVLQNQAIEVGQMRAWLADWDEPTTPPTIAMAWMGTDGSLTCRLADMPGLASDADLQELSLLDGEDQGRRWLELMRAHHVGGVTMAEDAATRAATAKVKRLAGTQARTQTYEISQYDHLLAGQYSS